MDATQPQVGAPHAGHELLRERDAPRLGCLRRIDAFLDPLAVPAPQQSDIR